MYWLLIDTSFQTGILALFQDGTLVEEVHLPRTFHNSQALMPELVKLVKAPSELDRIVVGIGPGSYTGMRVAMATAQGLAFPHSIPLVGACSLNAYLLGREGRGAVMADAKSGGVYVMEVGQDPKRCSVEEVLQTLPELNWVSSPTRSALEKRLGATFEAPTPSAHHFIPFSGVEKELNTLDLLYLRDIWD